MSLIALAVVVTLAADRFPSRVEEMPKHIAAGEAVWSWSDDCAPRRVSDPRELGECKPSQEIVITLDGGKQPAAGTHVRWGTEAMLRDIPDAWLPLAVADARGIAAMRIPAGERVFARAAGPVLASRWTALRAPRTTIAATRGAAVTLDVLERGGKPAARAFVEIRTADLPQPNGLVFRGVGDGTVTIPAIPAEGYTRTLAWSENGAPLLIAGNPRTLELAPGFGMRGDVADPEGESVEGAAVSALFFTAGDIAIRKSTRSDAKGAFNIRGLPAGNVSWNVAKDPYAKVARITTFAGDTDAGTITLDTARDLEVIVRDSRDQPIAGAAIRAGAVTAKTDDRGRARLTALPSQNVELHVSAPGYLARDVEIDGAAATPARVVLRDAARVRAQLVRAGDGQPAGPGTAAVELDGRKTLLDFDAEGLLEIDDLEAGALSLEIRAEGMSPFHLPARRIEDGERIDLGRIALDRGLAITGRAIDASGAPLRGVTVRVLRPSSFGPLLSYARRDWVTAESGDDGLFRLSGLAPGMYTLFTQAASRAPAVREAVEVSNADAELGDVEIPRGRTLVIDCQPAARCGTDAKVVLRGADWLPVGSPMLDGRATIAPVPEGAAMLRISSGSGVVHERDVTISRDADETRIAVKLAGVQVRGRVTRGGRPVAGGRVQLSTLSGQSAKFVQIAYAVGGGHLGNEIVGTVPLQFSAAVSQDGTFVFEDLSPGDYGATWSDDSAYSATRRVTIGNDAAPLHLDLSGASVRGIVRGAEGAQVFITAEPGGRILAESDGSFAFVGLAPGRTTIRASADAARAASAEVTLSDGETSQIELTLAEKEDRELIVHVRVHGAAVPNAYVFLRDGGTLRAATTAGDGRAVFRVARRSAAADLAVYAGSSGWTFVAPTDADIIEVDAQPSQSRLVVGVEEGSHALVIHTPGGFPLHSALAILGIHPAARPGAPFTVERLPQGRYVVVAGDTRQQLETRPSQ